MAGRHRIRVACVAGGPCGVVKLVMWSALICGLCARSTDAEEILTLTGSQPRVILDDIDGAQATWHLVGRGEGFDVQDWTTGSPVIPFRLDLGLPNDALRVTRDSNGSSNVGIGAIPPNGRNLYIVSRGSSAIISMHKNVNAAFRTWELFSNEVRFGIRDASTDLNATPFQIEAAAPHNTLVLDTTGSIGMGTTTPDENSRLDIRSSLLNGLLAKRADANAHFLRVENSVSAFRCGVQGNGDTQFGALTSGKGLNLLAGGTGKVAINSSGQISFGNVPPVFTTDALIHQTGARLTNVGVWTDASSRALKQDIEPITSEQARETVRALQPVGYRYKAQPEEPYVGFIAEDVPELVATSDRKSLAPMDIVAVLTKVVQDQQTLLDAQQKKLEKLEQQEATIATLMARLDAIERANAVAPPRD